MSTPVVANEVAVEIVIPSEKALLHASRLAIEQDKAIMLDYYNDSRNLKAFIGVNTDKKELLVKANNEEYTSFITKKYKVANEYIISTENSIYIVHNTIKPKGINMPSEWSNDN